MAGLTVSEIKLLARSYVLDDIDENDESDFWSDTEVSLWLKIAYDACVAEITEAGCDRFLSTIDSDDIGVGSLFTYDGSSILGPGIYAPAAVEVYTGSTWVGVPEATAGSAKYTSLGTVRFRIRYRSQVTVPSDGSALNAAADYAFCEWVALCLADRMSLKSGGSNPALRAAKADSQRRANLTMTGSRALRVNGQRCPYAYVVHPSLEKVELVRTQRGLG